MVSYLLFYFKLMANTYNDLKEFSDETLHHLQQLYTEEFVSLYFEGEDFKSLTALKKIILDIKKELCKRSQAVKNKIPVYS